LEDAITRVVEALGKSGGLAGIQEEMLTGFLASLGPQTEHAVPPVAGGRAVLRGLGFVAPIVIFNLDSKQAAADAKQTAAATGPSPAGQAALQVAAGPTGARRLVLDAKGTDRWVGVTPVRREGEGPSGDLAVNEAYDGLGLAYQFFREVFGRDSIDGAGMELVAVVHYGTNWANAVWNGESFIFGDGDGELFLRTTAGLDVIGHEYAYAILEFSVEFGSTGQAGSLWQSLADVFGVLTKQYKLHQTAAEADWLIGHDIAGPKLGLALRSLKQPGSAHPGDTQPSHMDQFVDSVDDSGVHINSGILNHAFYLVAIAIEGYAWEKAGHIWYEAFSDPALNEDATFLTFAAATSRATRRLYGEAIRELSAVTNAWAAVGIRVPAEAKP
ncbi:MAG: M4 family metallopeptidase, partial [Actinomycetota bacterium]|nr:M4 family metallopeptidase [Actinomycetota bacterium]